MTTYLAARVQVQGGALTIQPRVTAQGATEFECMTALHRGNFGTFTAVWELKGPVDGVAAAQLAATTTPDHLTVTDMVTGFVATLHDEHLADLKVAR